MAQIQSRFFRDPTFEWAVYLQLVNLKNCLPAIMNNVPFEEGEDKTAYRGNHGYFFVSDGQTLDKLIQESIVLRKNISSERKVKGINDVKRYIAAEKGDGAYFFDNTTNKMNKVKKIYIPGEIAKTIDEYQLLPEDFVHDGTGIPLEESNIGTKTLTALMLPQIHPEVRTTIVKSSPYGETGMGVVAGIGGKGVDSRLMLIYDSSLAESPISPAYFGLGPADPRAELLGRIVPVYQEFSGKVLLDEKMLQVDRYGRISLHDYKKRTFPHQDAASGGVQQAVNF